MPYKIEMLDADGLDVLPGRRSIDDGRVKEIAESMKMIGLREPITVQYCADRPSDDGLTEDSHVLITGAHRLAAAKLLGWKKIACFIEEGDARTARLWEISENLHRSDLTHLERSELLAEWIRLKEEDLKSVHSEPKSKTEKNPKGSGRKQTGVSAAARELGVDETDAKRAVKVAEKLLPEAKVKAKELGLDNTREALTNAAGCKGLEAQLDSLTRSHVNRSRGNKIKQSKRAQERKARGMQGEANRLRQQYSKAEIQELIDLLAAMLKA